MAANLRNRLLAINGIADNALADAIVDEVCLYLKERHDQLMKMPNGIDSAGQTIRVVKAAALMNVVNALIAETVVSDDV